MKSGSGASVVVPFGLEVRLAATPPTAGDDAVVRVLIAIELSRKSWIVGANTPSKVRISQFQFAVATRKPCSS
jgi:hypothetical protein